MPAYRLSDDAYEFMLERQEGKCPICGSDEPGRKKSNNLHVDHDHKTGIVRGLLCHQCNVGLGMFKDDPAILTAAIKYLEQTKVL